MSRYIHNQQATNNAFENLDFSDVGTMQALISVHKAIIVWNEKMHTKPQKPWLNSDKELIYLSTVS